MIKFEFECSTFACTHKEILNISITRPIIQHHTKPFGQTWIQWWSTMIHLMNQILRLRIQQILKCSPSKCNTLTMFTFIFRPDTIILIRIHGYIYTVFAYIWNVHCIVTVQTEWNVKYIIKGNIHFSLIRSKMQLFTKQSFLFFNKSTQTFFKSPNYSSELKFFI